MARNEAVGTARYTTEVDPSGLKKGLDEGEAKLRESGGRAEAAATKQASSAAAKLANIGKAGMLALSGVATGITVALVGRMQELDRATADFRQETGATAEEAKRAGQAINEMAGRNLQPIEEIGATLTKVRTDLGLTGDEAETVAEKFLRFGQATSQDAASAVLAFDDILDSWGLTAEDAAGIMDQLVASHERFGGSIEANQDALSALAPALRAMNLTVDDGVGLLNLFAASGIDAAAAQRGLNGAVTRLPKGENLRAFLDRVASIEDPTKRAAEAVKVFGTQAGVKLANALGPGKGALADYVIAADDVPGATEKAADASLTLVDRLKMGFEGFISGTVDLLGPAGPLLTALASMAPLLAPALGKAVSAAGPALGAVGKRMGQSLAGTKGILDGIASTLGGSQLGSVLGNTKVTAAFAKLGSVLGKSIGVAAGIGAAFVLLDLPSIQIEGGLTSKQEEDLSRFVADGLARGLNSPGGNESWVRAQKILAAKVMFMTKEGFGEAKAEAAAIEYVDGVASELQTRTRDVLVPVMNNLWTAPIEHAEASGAAVAQATVEGLTAEWKAMGDAPIADMLSWLDRNFTFLRDHLDELPGDLRENIEMMNAELDQGLRAQQDIWTRMAPPPEIDYGGPARAVRRTLGDAFRTMNEAKQPWKDAWADLAEWAKDPFRPKVFAQWLEDKHDDAIRRANKAAREGKPKVAERWREIAKALKSPIIAALGEVTGDVDKLIQAIIVMNRLNEQVGKGIARMGTTTKVAGRASGGPTEAGKAYVVGEDGPELWMERSAGHVVSTPALAGLMAQAMSMSARPQAQALSGSATVHHVVEISPGSAMALRDAGLDSAAIARILGGMVADARGMAGLRFTAPRRV